MEEQTQIKQDKVVQSRKKPLFDNLVTMSGIQELLQQWLGRSFHRDTVYRWVKKREMPVRRFAGEFYFPVEEVAAWIKRTMDNGDL